MPRAWRRWPTTSGQDSRPTLVKRLSPRPAALRAVTHALLVLTAGAGLLTGCANPPQVVQISPDRGARDVRSTQPIRIRFDRAVDQRSVATRLRVQPRVNGSIRWLSDREVVLDHQPLLPSTTYQVVLDSGYSDVGGHVNSLRHSWSFITEGPPALAGSSPGAGDRDVDPAAYLSLSFSREMNLGSLSTAISVSPQVRFSLRQDPGDQRRVILAPGSLLEPAKPYSVAITQDATDADGNRLRAGSVISFTTGALRPLKHWVSFTVEATTGAGGDGVWIVDENRFPRRVVSAPVDSFSWSQDGLRLLMRSPAGAWSQQALDGSPGVLPFVATWAGFLAPGRGYAYLDNGSLRILNADGSVVDVASEVGEASIAPGGTRLAYTVRGHPGPEIDAYDVVLRARYRLQVESAPVDGLAWSPDGLALAYRLVASDPQRSQVRARLLAGSARSVTVATGEVSTPTWQADSRHLIFTAPIDGSGGRMERVFRLAAGDPPPKTLTAAQALPSTPDLATHEASPSPDGHQIAFLADFQGRPAVWLMNADGTGVVRLTEFDPAGPAYSCRALAWTPI